MPRKEFSEKLNVLVNFFVEWHRDVGYVHRSGAAWNLRTVSGCQVASKLNADIARLYNENIAMLALLPRGKVVAHEVFGVALAEVDGALSI